MGENPTHQFNECFPISDPVTAPLEMLTHPHLIGFSKIHLFEIFKDLHIHLSISFHCFNWQTNYNSFTFRWLLLLLIIQQCQQVEHVIQVKLIPIHKNSPQFHKHLPDLCSHFATNCDYRKLEWFPIACCDWLSETQSIYNQQQKNTPIRWSKQPQKSCALNVGHTFPTTTISFVLAAKFH